MATDADRQQIPGDIIARVQALEGLEPGSTDRAFRDAWELNEALVL